LNPQIRVATQRDLEGVYRVEDDSFSEPYPHKLLARLLRESPDSFFVAEVKPRTIVGYCAAVREESYAHLISIGVLREYRRHGVGKALIQALVASFCSEIVDLRLEVKQGNTEALELYEGLGFRRISLIENYYEDGSTAVKMRLAIDGGLGKDSSG
jgi:ribosomal-protein-alanine N-acetyltransferase